MGGKDDPAAPPANIPASAGADIAAETLYAEWTTTLRRDADDYGMAAKIRALVAARRSAAGGVDINAWARRALEYADEIDPLRAEPSSSRPKRKGGA